MPANAWEWELSDLEGLISAQAQESLYLDYKESRAIRNDQSFRNEFSKDVSAFANADGGTIIFGIRENGHFPADFDEGVDVNQFTKEWLEQVLQSCIQPRIPDVRIRLVLRGTRGLFIISIPKSSRAPHQALDKKYYKRLNFASEPMFDYEIRDVQSRARAPDLGLEFQAVQVENADPAETARSVDLKPILYNQSAQPAEYYVVKILVAPPLVVTSRGEFAEAPSEGMVVRGESFKGSTLQLNGHSSQRMPVFSGLKWGVVDRPIRIRMPGNTNEGEVCWMIYSPGMTPRARVVRLQKTDRAVTVHDIGPATFT